MRESKQSISKKHLPPNQQLVSANRWPIIGERMPADPDHPKPLTVDGLVANPLEFDAEELSRLPQTELDVDVHCVTRWSKLGVNFSGVLLADLLILAEVLTQGAFVSFIADSTRNHSSSLPLLEAIECQTLIATSVEGNPLPIQHGGPIRGIVPGKYFYKSVKWLSRIELLEHDRRGFWESNAGYHNGADPWLEQRYMAPSIDRRKARQLIESRDFSGHDLRSIDVSSQQLDKLRAAESLLRNANFALCSLRGAIFDGANLSNANFHAADLRDASFNAADVEGANFNLADLRGADMRGCSLIGASFCEQKTLVELGDSVSGAKIDSTTRIEPQSLAALTAIQHEYVSDRLKTNRI